MKQIRKRNLLALVGTHRGAIKEFAEKHGIDPSHISQIKTGHRQLGENAAREMEKKIGLPSLALDSIQVHGTGNGALIDIEKALNKADWLTPESKAHILGFVKELKPKS